MPPDGYPRRTGTRQIVEVGLGLATGYPGTRTTYEPVYGYQAGLTYGGQDAFLLLIAERIASGQTALLLTIGICMPTQDPSLCFSLSERCYLHPYFFLVGGSTLDTCSRLSREEHEQNTK